MLHQYREKLPDNAKTNDLLEFCDNLNKSTHLLAGCILTEVSDIYVVPNGRRFILGPKTHASAAHTKRTCAYQGVRNVRFSENFGKRALVSCYLHFEIRLFALLPTNKPYLPNQAVFST